MNVRDYTEKVRNAIGIIHRDCHLYQGEEGAKRLAREYGAGLADFAEKEAEDALRSSYTQVCVMGYDLQPPIDAREWIVEVKKGYERTREKNRR